MEDSKSKDKTLRTQPNTPLAFRAALNHPKIYSLMKTMEKTLYQEKDYSKNIFIEQENDGSSTLYNRQC